AREMLVAAAAETWGVDKSACHADKGAVIHAPSKRVLTYGKLVAKAATVPLPHDVPLKDPKDWKILGTRARRLDTPPKVDASGTLASSASKIDAAYDLPFLAHATMEPMNCTAHVRSDGVDIWAPTQFQTGAQGLGAKIGGVTPDKVLVHTTYLGGGFGRRFELDFMQGALETSTAAAAP